MRNYLHNLENNVKVIDMSQRTGSDDLSPSNKKATFIKSTYIFSFFKKKYFF